jgi:hypothetical protein
VDERVPAAVGERGPGRVALGVARQPEQLGVPGRAVAPAVADRLYQVRQELRGGVPDQETVPPALVAGHDVRDARKTQLDQVGAARRVADPDEGVGDAQRAVRHVVEAGFRARAVRPVTPHGVFSAARRQGSAARTANSGSPTARAAKPLPPLPPISSKSSPQRSPSKCERTRAIA